MYCIKLERATSNISIFAAISFGSIALCVYVRFVNIFGSDR